MKKLLPQSLVGQLLALVALALLVAQAINMVLLYRGAQRQNTMVASASAIARIAGAIERQDRQQNGRHYFRPKMRGAHPKLSNRSLVADEPGRMTDVEQRALQAFDSMEFQVLSVKAAKLDQVPPAMKGSVIGLHRGPPGMMRRHHIEGQLGRPMNTKPSIRKIDSFILMSVQLSDDQWINMASIVHKQNPAIIWRLLIQTALLYLIVLVPLILMGRRLSRSLKALTNSAQNFHPGGSERLEASGPEDMQQLIRAYNDMNARVGNMLNEKDVMLGAIGHDLRTPLAALRVRIENVEDAAERERMINGIEDLDRMLDDILSLARLGRSQEQAERTDISALIETVADEFSDLGDDVSFERSERMTASIKATLIRRALRNLISNAVNYGKRAVVSVEKTGDKLLIYVDDQGPGVTEERIGAMFEPFVRAEGSRNRGTGGSGLGLTLARAIARDHGGDVTLANREEGGLRASLILPAAY